MATLAPGLARKVKKILEIKTESPELLNSLATLSTFYEENTPQTRRTLRTTIEQRGLDIHQQFLDVAGAVIQALDGVQQHLDSLTHSCDTIAASLGTARGGSNDLLADTERLQRDLAAADRRQQLVHDFLHQYQLRHEEVVVLQSERVGGEFFGALARVRTIHDNCKALLRTHHQRAGLELMDLMSSYQEAAYEHLCRWVQRECRDIGDFDAPEVDPLLQQAVRALRERPVLFRYCMEEVAGARHNALFQRFITALTRGGPGGLPRPIEIHAHDPQRYINDMLAWVHQALASEREFVVALVGEEEGSAATPLPAVMVADGEAPLHTGALLDRIFESICRPLKVRIEQVLLALPAPLVCFQLTQLLAFYSDLVTSILGASAQLPASLAACHDIAHRVFFEQLRTRGDKLIRNPPPPPPDLSPPPQVLEALHQLQDIIAAHENAPHAPTPASATTFNSVVAACLEPLVEMCTRSAEVLRPDAPTRVDEGGARGAADPGAHRIYLVNCLSALQAALALRSCTADVCKQVADMVEQHVAALVGGEVGALLGRCGLGEVAERMRLYQDPEGQAAGSTPAGDPALALPVVARAMGALVEVASQPDALPEFLQLQVPKVRADAASRVAGCLMEVYEAVYATVEDPTSGYAEQGGATALRHSPAQLRTILGVV